MDRGWQEPICHIGEKWTCLGIAVAYDFSGVGFLDEFADSQSLKIGQIVLVPDGVDVRVELQ